MAIIVLDIKQYIKKVNKTAKKGNYKKSNKLRKKIV